jgi:type I restriction enzyme, S subunit
MIPIEKSGLPKNWRWGTIPDLTIKGGVFVDGDWVESKDQDPNGDIRLIQLADIGDGVYRDRSSRFLTKKKALDLGCTFLKPNDVLIARMPEPLGRSCIFPGDSKPAVTVVDICVVRSNNGNFNHHWLSHFLNAPQFRNAVVRLQAGSTRKRISRKNLATIPFPIPPLPNQVQIAEEIEKQFSRLDAGVGALRRTQEKLKKYRAAVLKAACEGRLVPTEAELAKKEGRTYETGPQLLARILATRRKKWQGRGKYKEPAMPDTKNFPSLPEGWAWATIEQITSLVGTGGTPYRGKRVYWERGTIPWITSGSLNNNTVISSQEFITPLAVQETNAKIFPAGTILIALYGEGKTRGKVAELGINAATNQACAALLFDRFNSGVRRYLKVFLKKNYEDIRRLSSGGVQPNLNLSIVRQTCIPLPPLCEQERIVDETERQLSVVEGLETAISANLQRTDRLRQSVLQNAFLGKLVPTKSEKQVPAAPGLNGKRNLRTKPGGSS